MLQLHLIFFLPFPRNVDLFHFIVKKFERVNQQWQVLYRNKMQQIMQVNVAFSGKGLSNLKQMWLKKTI